MGSVEGSAQRFWTHLCDGSITQPAVAHVAIVADAGPAGDQQVATGLDTRREGPSAQGTPLTTLSLTLSLTPSLTHQVVTASVSPNTLIDRFTVPPASFEPAFTHAVALQGDSEMRRVASGGRCCCCCLSYTCCCCCCSYTCCCSPVQGRRRRRWRWGGNRLCQRPGSC